MGLITQKPNYSIAGGDTTFEAVQLEEAAAVVQALYSGIDSADVQLYLEQSPDGSNWNAVSASAVVLDNNKPSHLFNINLKRGLFIRVGVLQGTATAGTIDSINYLI
jgi:hypothetical protein